MVTQEGATSGLHTAGLLALSFFNYYIFICFWLCWIFVAVRAFL